jgi:hypothetical protein
MTEELKKPRKPRAKKVLITDVPPQKETKMLNGIPMNTIVIDDTIELPSISIDEAVDLINNGGKKAPRRRKAVAVAVMGSEHAEAARWAVHMIGGRKKHAIVGQHPYIIISDAPAYTYETPIHELMMDEKFDSMVLKQIRTLRNTIIGPGERMNQALVKTLDLYNIADMKHHYALINVKQCILPSAHRAWIKQICDTACWEVIKFYEPKPKK